STEFKKLVSNYEDGYKSWKFKGTRPAIIDFYASWCGPCKQLSPIVLELAKEYKGKIDFYKVNIDDNKDIAIAYSVASIPMLMLAPVTGNPQVLTGLYPKDEIIKAINFVFYPKTK
ncbi:MAG: thioredoxin, partial [Muribaculaceae bacterium]